MACARWTARRRMCRGSPSYGVPSGVRMSQNIRPTAWSPPRQGRTAKVFGSGTAIMSDSSIALKPVIEEPSKPMPPSKASASLVLLMLKAFRLPRMSVNHRRMKRMPSCSTRARTSLAVSAGSLIAAEPYLVSLRRDMARRPIARLAPDGLGGDAPAQPALRPLLQLVQRWAKLAAHLRQRVLDTDRWARMHGALDDAARFEFLHAGREQAVGELRHRLADL